MARLNGNRAENKWALGDINVQNKTRSEY